MSNTATKETTDLHPAMAERVDEIDEHVRNWSGSDTEYVESDYDASGKATIPEADMKSNVSLDASDDGTALEDADVEIITDTAPAEDYDIARDEMYETDLLGEDSDLDQDRASDLDDTADTDTQLEDSSYGSGGDGSG